MTSQNSHPKRFSGFVNRMAGKILGLVLAGLMIHLVFPYLASLDKSLAVMRSLKQWAVLLAILAQIISYTGSGMTIKTLVKSTGHSISILRGVMITLAGTSVGTLAGGMFGTAAVTYRWVKASGAGEQGASLSASLPPIFIDLVLLVLSLFGIINLFFAHDLSKIQAIAFVLIAVLLTSLTFLLFLAFRDREKSKKIVLDIASPILKIFKKSAQMCQGQVKMS